MAASSPPFSAPILVWDWNGTLLDDTHIVFDSTNAVMAALNRPQIERRTFHDRHVIPLERFYRSMGISEDEIQMLNKDRHIFHDYYEKYNITAKLREGAADLLRDLKSAGAISLILSNHVEGAIRKLLRRFDIETLFADVLAYASPEMQFKDMTKGERLRRYAMAKDYDLSRAVIVGDTREEIQIGREQGLTSVAITGGITNEEPLRQEGPDYMIDTLPELRPILRERGFAL